MIHRDDEATYFQEAKSLRESYRKALGDALELGIKVHVKGEMKALGDLREEIRNVRERQWDRSMIHVGHRIGTKCTHKCVWIPPKV